MKLVEDLGRLTEERWRREGYKEEALPDVALRVFEETAPYRHLGLDDLVAGVLGATRLEAQGYRSIDQRILIPYHGRRFYLEVIFWVDEVAFPHHHSFSGAFHVLSGLRVHATYAFEERRRVTSGFRLGELALAGAELLDTGASRPIHAGSRLIHSLSHVDRPSISLVLATDHAVGEPQLNYLPPHVAHAPRHGDRVLATQLRALELLHDVDPERHVEALARQVAAADPHSGFELLRHGFERIRDAEAFDRVLAAARAAHGEAADLLAAVFAEQRRRLWFLRRRAAGGGPDERLLHALLLHVPSRSKIFALLAARFPGVDPAAWIVERIPGLDPGIPFDDTALLVLRLLLEGKSPEEVRAALVHEHGYDAADVDSGDLGELCAALTAAPLLRALFGDG